MTAMPQQPVTYMVYTGPEGEVATAPSVEMPAVTYMAAPQQVMYTEYGAPATAMSYVAAPTEGVVLDGAEYAMAGTSYTYLDYANAYFADEAPALVEAVAASTVAETSGAEADKALSSPL